MEAYWPLGELRDWAASTGHDLHPDVALLAETVRGALGRREGDWPAGSAAELLEHWPEDRAVLGPPPGPEDVVEALTTWWLFLVATGRMRAGSAEPLELRAEARRALVTERPDLPRGDPERAARQARESAYVRSCLRLADWVGERREVGRSGRLRPQEARAAVRELGLGVPEVDWTGVADHRPLERLWTPAAWAGLVRVHATVASDTHRRPLLDEEWAPLAGRLVAANAGLVHQDLAEPLVGLLLLLAGEAGGVAGLNEVRAWWQSLEPVGQRRSAKRSARHADRLERALVEFDDVGLWRRQESRLAITDLGRECLVVLVEVLGAEPPG